MNPWDERYNKAEYHYGTESNDFLRAHAESLLTGKGNRVLCLATWRLAVGGMLQRAAIRAGHWRAADRRTHG